MSDLIEWAAKFAVVQSALGAGVFIYLWQIIKRGEREPAVDVQARWKAHQDLSDISENMKTLVVYQKEIRDQIKRLTDVVWNRNG